MGLLGTFAGASSRAYGLQAGTLAEGALVLIKTVSATSSSSISVSNCFSDTYLQYKIIFDLQGVGGGANINMRMNTTGDTADTGTIYSRERLEATSTTYAAVRPATTTFWEAVSNAGTGVAQCSITEIFYPYQTSYTTLFSESMTTATGNIELVMTAFSTTSTTSFSGFTVLPSSNTLTGTVSVYGFKLSA